jgi:CHAD domain-containing protein
MSEYLPPEGWSLSAAGKAVARVFDSVQDGRAREVDRTFYDTFDGLLHRAGLSLVLEGGAFDLVERGTGTRRAHLAGASPAERLFVAELPAGPLRDALRLVVDVRALLPLVRVHCRERPLDLLDDERKTVVRVALEQPALVGSERTREVSLRPRVRIAAIRGYERELRRVCRTLEDDLGFSPADEPLVDEAVRAAGGVPGGISSKPDLALAYADPADRATAVVLRALLRVIEANYEGTIDDIDSEFLHDLRVAVRRSRAVQRELRGVFPPEQLAHFRAEFRWLQQATGDARDLDVYVLEFDRYRALVPADMRADLEPVLEVLREHRRVARAGMVRALRSARASRLLREWSSFLDSLDGPAPPIGELAGERIRKVYRRMVRMGDAIDASSPAEDYHELRKKGKELRYLLELFGGPLYPREVVGPMVKALKGLQDVLGRHQDLAVQASMLRSLRDEVAAQPGGAAALMAMGALVHSLQRDQATARAAFAERFAEFASNAQRKRVRQTFA